MKQIGTRLSNEIFERLQKDAEKSGTNISDLLRQIVGEHYEKAASAEEHAITIDAIKQAH
jgi:predicted DNA-binding protein